MSLIARQLEHVSGFDPRSLPGLEAWYDAKYINGFGAALPADDATLSQWNDLSGKNKHLAQATAGSRPTYRKANVNLLSAQRATAGDQLAAVTGFGGPNGSTTSYDTTMMVRGAGCIKATLPATSSGSTVGFGIHTFTIGTATGNLLPNTTYTFSGYGYNPSTNALTPGMQLSAQGNGLAAPLSSGTTNVKDTWLRMTITLTTLSTGSIVLYLLNGTGFGTAAGDVLWGDCFQVELGSTATTWVPPMTYPSVYMGDAARSMGATLTPTGEVSVYIAMQGNFTVAYSGFSAYGGSSDTRMLLLSSSAVTGLHYRIDRGADAVNQTRYINSPPLYNYAPHVLKAVTSLLQQTGRAGVDSTNGAVLSLTGSTSTIPGDFSLSSSSASASHGFHSVIVYSKAHDSATQRRIENWLASRYAVSLARP